jgi:hypothetical protein
VGAWEALTGAGASPPERRELAWLQALLPTTLGGAGIHDTLALSGAAYAASYLAAPPRVVGRSAIVAICTRWQRAREPTTGQATVVVVTNAAQHSCHSAAAWSAAGARRPTALEMARRARSSAPRARGGDETTGPAGGCV